MLAEALGRGQEWLGREELTRLARAYGLPVLAAGHDADGPGAPGGTELRIGVTQDPAFGAVVACAAGGAMAGLLDDVAVRLVPLDSGDAEAMLRSLRLHPILAGPHGDRDAGIRAVAAVVRRVAALADAHPEVRELAAEPVIAHPEGVVITDLRVRVAPAAARSWAPDSVRVPY